MNTTPMTNPDTLVRCAIEQNIVVARSREGAALKEAAAIWLTGAGSNISSQHATNQISENRN